MNPKNQGNCMQDQSPLADQVHYAIMSSSVLEMRTYSTLLVD